MPDFPEVTILICTYDRPAEIAATVEALRTNLSYPADRLRWLVCDDSSPSGYIARLKRNKWPKGVQFVSTVANSGWGANVNNGLRSVATDYIFFIEDDYVLQKPLDLTVGVTLLEAHPDIGMLRYRGTAGSHIIHHQFEANIAAWLPDYRDGLGVPGKLTYLQLDSGSPSTFIYSHGPHLKRRGFHDFYGAYPEGLKLGETEELYALRVKDGMKIDGSPAIAILPDWVLLWFDHIGQSYQLTGADKRYVEKQTERGNQ